MRVGCARSWLILAVFLCCPAAPIAVHADDVAAPPPEMLKLRDPFRRPEIQGGDLVQKTELETFPVDQLKMMGVATGPRHMKAMILAPNGKTYFVAMRTKMGLRKGIVTQIDPEFVKIREKVVNVLGQEEDVESVLKLPSEYKNGTVAGFVGEKQ